MTDEKLATIICSLDTEPRKSVLIRLEHLIQYVRLCSLIDLEARFPGKPIDRDEWSATKF